MYFSRRLKESLFVIVLTSVFFWMLIKIGLLNPDAYTIIFGISLIINLLANYFFHSIHFDALGHNVTKYLKVNLSIFGIFIALNAIAIAVCTSSQYTAFFAYTKAFRKFIAPDVNARNLFAEVCSALIYWVLYLCNLFLVIYIGMKRKRSQRH